MIIKIIFPQPSPSTSPSTLLDSFPRKSDLPYIQCAMTTLPTMLPPFDSISIILSSSRVTQLRNTDEHNYAVIYKSCVPLWSRVCILHMYVRTVFLAELGSKLLGCWSASRDKINIGIGTYGRGFTLADPAENGLGAVTIGPSPAEQYTGEAGYLAYYEVSGYKNLWSLHHAVPCRDLPCHAMPCEWLWLRVRAVQCRAVSCRVVLSSNNQINSS